MRWKTKCLIVLLLAACSHPICAQQTPDKPATDNAPESPSPDGRFAFLSANNPDKRAFNLIEKKSGKVLRSVADADDDTNELAIDSVLWSPSSKRFALTDHFHNRRMNDLSVFFRSGDTFREIKLPELPEVTIPIKFQKAKERLWHITEWHMNVVDWKQPIRWLKDGSLVVEIETTIDRDGHSATATRTIVLGFDRAGAATILKSTQKLTSHTDQ